MNNATMSEMRNPYIIGRPITEQEFFFGRENLLEFINENLEQKNKFVLLYGQRRIGKTSVLNQIPNSVKGNKFVFFSFDLQDKGNLPLSDILNKLAQEIVEYLELDVISPSLEELQEDSNIFDSKFLPEIYSLLNGKNLVLLLDEFDVLDRDDFNSGEQHFFTYLKSVVQRQEKLFAILVVGRELERLPKLLDLFRGASYRKIGLLDEFSAKQQITKPSENLLKYHPDAIQRILELSANHPYFTQLLCFEIFQRAREEKRWEVSRTDVEKIVDTAIESGEAGFVWFHQGLPVPERVVFSAVAELQRLEDLEAESTVKKALTLLANYGVVETDSLREAENRLKEWDYLSSNPANNKSYSYKVTIELVRRWLLRKYSLRKVIDLLENNDLNATNIYIQATEMNQQSNFATAVDLYERVLRINPNHFSAVMKLAEGYLDLKEFTKAIEYCKRAYKIEPVRYQEMLVQAQLSYSEHLMQHKEWTSAQQQLNEALALDPNNTLVNQQLQKLQNEIAKASRTPFFVGQACPPDQFVGRDYELKTALAQIWNSSTCFVYGSPGIGKTSFLKYLASDEIWQAMIKNNHNKDKYLFVYLDCEFIDNFTSSNFWREVLTEIQNLLKSSRINTNINSLDSKVDLFLQEREVTKTHVKQVLREIKQEGMFLVLLLDNYNTVFSAKNDPLEAEILNFLKGFSYLIQNDGNGCLSAIMTSSQTLHELVSPNMNNFLPSAITLILKRFEVNEVDILWNRMPEKFKERYELRESVKNITGGYPALVHLTCSLLYNVGQHKQSVDNEQFKRNFDGSAEQIFLKMWQSFNDKKKLLMKFIALYNVEGLLDNKSYDLSGIENSFINGEGELDIIEKHGIITSISRQDKRTSKKIKVYYFTASTMQEWVIRQMNNSDKSEFDFIEKGFLGMNKEQINQVKKIRQSVKENAEAVEPVIRVITGILPFIVG